MEITEKVAYLKGLAEGLALDAEANKESKLIAAMIDILDDIALEIADMKDVQQELGDGLDAVSEDLEDVEDLIYDEDEDSDEDEDEDDDEDCYATTCPSCEETIYFDDSVLEEGEVVCPNCGERLEFDTSDIEDETSGPSDET